MLHMAHSTVHAYLDEKAKDRLWKMHTRSRMTQSALIRKAIDKLYESEYE